MRGTLALSVVIEGPRHDGLPLERVWARFEKTVPRFSLLCSSSFNHPLKGALRPIPTFMVVFEATAANSGHVIRGELARPHQEVKDGRIGGSSKNRRIGSKGW